MEINTVIDRDTDYLVNGTLVVPKIEGNRHYRGVLEWIAQGGVVQPEFTEEELRVKALAIKKREILSNFSKHMKNLTVSYTEEEQKTWNTQLEEAKAYIADNTAITPMLSEILEDGDTLLDLASRVIAKADYLKVESGKLLKIKNEALKALDG